MTLSPSSGSRMPTWTSAGSCPRLARIVTSPELSARIRPTSRRAEHLRHLDDGGVEHLGRSGRLGDERRDAAQRRLLVGQALQLGARLARWRSPWPRAP